MYLRRLRHVTMEIVYLTVDILQPKKNLRFLFSKQPWNHHGITVL